LIFAAEPASELRTSQLARRMGARNCTKIAQIIRNHCLMVENLEKTSENGNFRFFFTPQRFQESG
jgi:hypothetical protein